MPSLFFTRKCAPEGRLLVCPRLQGCCQDGTGDLNLYGAAFGRPV